MSEYEKLRWNIALDTITRRCTNVKVTFFTDYHGENSIKMLKPYEIAIMQKSILFKNRQLLLQKWVLGASKIRYKMQKIV